MKKEKFNKEETIKKTRTIINTEFIQTLKECDLRGLNQFFRSCQEYVTRFERMSSEEPENFTIFVLAKVARMNTKLVESEITTRDEQKGLFDE